MIIKELTQKPQVDINIKLKEAYTQFEKLLAELRKVELPDFVVEFINQGVEELNSSTGSGEELRRMVKVKQTRIIKLLEKELKLVPKNYYRNIWLAVGIGAFGLPLGVVFGASFGNMAFLGIGLPIGMAIGIGVGARMDKKAFEDGRQLDIEIES